MRYECLGLNPCCNGLKLPHSARKVLILLATILSMILTTNEVRLTGYNFHVGGGFPSCEWEQPSNLLVDILLPGS